MNEYTLINNLETLIIIIILISQSGFIFFAYLELKSDQYFSNIEFINNIFSALMLWIIESILLILFFLFSNALYINNTIIYISILASILLLSVIITLLDFIAKNNINFIPILPINLISALCIFLIIISKIPLHIAFNISLIIYASISAFFSVVTYKKKEMTSRFGLIYTFSTLAIILTISTLTRFWSFTFILFIDLSLCLMLSISFFLYYGKRYTLNIMEKMDSIQSKNNELLHAETKIISLAYWNSITHLKNSNKLQEDIKLNCFKQAYLIVINIENFKNLGNLLGYDKSNETLLEIVSILKSLLNDKDTLYNLFYDKFVFLHDGDLDSTLILIESILKAFKMNTFASMELVPYIGVTHISDAAKTFDNLIKELGLASQSAKNNHTDYEFYSDELYDVHEYNSNLESKLRAAVKKNQWDMYFQPKLSLEENKIIGAEALIRWKAQGTPISPEVFIPLSEQLGLINEIGSFVIDKTFEYVNTLGTLGFGNLVISINLSAHQLMDPDFLDYIKQSIKKHSVNPSNITFEITETSLINNITEINDMFLSLKELGFALSLDDFGTGYSSLSYISKLNLDEIKFDRTFTQSLLQNEKNMIMLDSITDVTKKLGVNIVIEGVETIDQFHYVQALGCDFYQGYLYSKPVPFEAFVKLCKQSTLPLD